MTSMSVNSLDAPFTVRVAMTSKAEPGLARQPGPGRASLHLSRAFHACCGVQTKTLMFVDTFVTDMVQLSLSLRLPMIMARRLACVRRAAASRLVMWCQPPPPNAGACRQRCLDMFVAGGAIAALWTQGAPVLALHEAWNRDDNLRRCLGAKA